MNCEKFLAVANDLAREQIQSAHQDGFAGMPQMETNERESALAHAKECDSCAGLWEEECGLTLGLRNLAQETSALSAPPELEAKMLTAFRERGKVTPIVRPFPTPGRQTRYWLAAVAAALLIVFGVFLVRGRVSNGAKPQVAVDKTAQPENTPGVQANVEAKQIYSKAPASPPRRNPTNRFVSTNPAVKRLNGSTNAVAVAAKSSEEDQGNKEVVTDFFPIGYGNAPNLQDGGQLLRVELPRSAVTRFGLPINMDRTSERVKADVLVGADGLAQAIRFVH
jgi:hypothetical protein